MSFSLFGITFFCFFVITFRWQLFIIPFRRQLLIIANQSPSAAFSLSFLVCILSCFCLFYHIIFHFVIIANQSQTAAFSLSFLNVCLRDNTGLFYDLFPALD